MKPTRRGQAAIMVSLSLVVTLGGLGLVVDVGWAYWRKVAAQTAAQSAALAAAIAVVNNNTFSCGSDVTCSPNSSTWASCDASPSNPPSNNIGNGCLYAQKNGFVNSGRQTVQYLAATPPSLSPVTGVNPAYWVQFQVGETLPVTFSAILGRTLMSVNASSTAGVFNPAGSCVYGLNQSAPGTVNLGGGAIVQTNCGVWDNSSSGSALSCSNNTSLTDTGGAGINVSGGSACSGNVSPAPNTYRSHVTDPFANIPAPPDMNRCDSSGIHAGDSITMPADGVYEVCSGGITMNGNGSLTLPAGLYYLKGGGLSWQNGTITGTGVTIYLEGGGSVTINGGMNVNLTAPTSGTYRGLVVFQQRGLTSPPNQKFNGGAGMDFTGSIYMPGSQLTYNGGGSTTITGLVADTITFSGNATFAADLNNVTGLNTPSVAIIE